MEKTKVAIERPEGRSCGTCSFFGVHKTGQTMCRAHPPVTTQIAVADPNGGVKWLVSSAFSMINPEDWCGEYKPQDAKI